MPQGNQFQTRISGQTIIDQLVQNMELGRLEMGYSILLPCLFSVYLHPDDYARIAPVADLLREDAKRALGARMADVLGLVLRQGARQLVVGLAAGLAIAYALTLPLGFVFLEVRRTDPATYGLVVGTVSLVALLAVWFPARRAASIDPLVALRHE